MTTFSAVNNSLAPPEQVIPDSLSGDLRLLIQAQLFSSSENQESYHSAQLIIDIINYCGNPLSPIAEIFFTALVKDYHWELKPYLEKLLFLCEKGTSEAFFKCVSTKKSQYYPAEILLDIIDDFYSVVNSPGQSLTALSNFLNYDEGGKEYLAQLKINPSLSSEVEGMPSAPSAPSPFRLNDLFIRKFSFLQMKAAAIRYLSSLSPHNRSSSEIYLRVFNNFQDNPDNEKINVSLIRLILLTTTMEARPVMKKYALEDIKEMLDAAYLTHQNWGEEILSAMCHSPKILKGWSLLEVTRFLKLLIDVALRADAFDMVSGQLDEFKNGFMDFGQLLTALEKLSMDSDKDTLSSSEDLACLMNRFRGADPHVSFPLPTTHLSTIEEQYIVIEEWCDKWKNYSLDQLTTTASAIREKAQNESLKNEEVLQLIAIGRIAIYRNFHKYLYSTQVLTVLGQLCYDNGCIAQAKTGEGKSFVITLLAFVLAMQNKSVHIISSSRNLVIRDQRAAFDFFKAFEIKTSNICVDNANASRFQAQILYGTASDYEFAVMRELLHFTPLFQQKANSEGEKRFDFAIVDELDNLTIDTAKSSARLAYPADITYDWVYNLILQFVRENIAESQKEKLSSTYTIEKLRQFLINCSNGDYKIAAKQISDEKLGTWLEFAYHALYLLKEKKHYVVDPSKTRMGQSANGISIVDAKNTGQIMSGSRWSNGLHEFVEAKHNLVSEKESLMPISLTHSVFYQLYRSLYGLTGTLGSRSEREEIKEIYGADSFDVPTYRPIQREDKPVRLVATNELHLSTILNEVKKCVVQGRPILVLCESIGDTEVLESLLICEGISLELLNVRQKKLEEEILANAGNPGAVTVATNTAGRGADIVLRGSSHDNGGLHVLLTFFPESLRVEEQARGRAGRQGQKGSSEIILSVEKLLTDDFITMNHSAITVQFLHEHRDNRIRMMKHDHLCRAKLERHCFSFVKHFFASLAHFNRTIQDERFDNDLAHTLADYKLVKAKDLRSDLLLLDHRIAKEALRLLIDRSFEPSKWKMLLKRTKERLLGKALNHWSLHFYQELEKLLVNSELLTHSVQHGFLEEITKSLLEKEGNLPLSIIFSCIEKQFAQKEKEMFFDIKKQVEGLYDQHKSLWEKCLDPSGSGMLEYLREITQVSFRLDFSHSSNLH